jgi:hypothetical protein
MGVACRRQEIKRKKGHAYIAHSKIEFCDRFFGFAGSLWAYFCYGGVHMTHSEKYKTGDSVPKDGVYTDEWGREEVLHEGASFPEDPQMGQTEWKIVHYPFDNQQTGRTIDERFRSRRGAEDLRNAKFAPGENTYLNENPH